MKNERETDNNTVEMDIESEDIKYLYIFVFQEDTLQIHQIISKLKTNMNSDGILMIIVKCGYQKMKMKNMGI